MKSSSRLFVLSVACCYAGFVFAASADRREAVQIEADRIHVDDRQKTQVFEGNVVLRQGSLLMRGDKMRVQQAADGFQNGVVTGKPATFRQKKEDGTGYIEGQAQRIEYDARDERVRLFEQARVRSGGDEISGQFIEYDALTEKYIAAAAPEGKQQGTGRQRVKVILQPREKK